VDLCHHATFCMLVLCRALEHLFLATPPDTYKLTSHTDTAANAYMHRLVLSFASFFVLLTWIRVMNYLRVIKEVGVLVEIIVLMLYSLKALVMVWILFILAFAFAYTVSIGETTSSFAKFGDSLTYSFQASVGMTDPEPFSDAGMGPLIMWVAEVIFLSLFLLNLLIALLNTAYSDIIDQAESQYLVLRASLTMSYYIPGWQLDHDDPIESEDASGEQGGDFPGPVPPKAETDADGRGSAGIVGGTLDLTMLTNAAVYTQ